MFIFYIYLTCLRRKIRPYERLTYGLKTSTGRRDVANSGARELDRSKILRAATTPTIWSKNTTLRATRNKTTYKLSTTHTRRAPV
jgi:hypothetical protein